jgi:hypothetical protein
MRRPEGWPPSSGMSPFGLHQDALGCTLPGAELFSGWAGESPAATWFLLFAWLAPLSARSSDGRGSRRRASR